MPVTPFHLGPGLAFKALLAGAFSFAVFALTQVLIDIEPAVRILLDSERLHAHVHTYSGATLIGAVCALAGRPACEWALRLWNRRLDARQARWLAVDPVIPRRAAWSGALLGAWSHVALDSVMHADMEPYWPFGPANPLLGLLSTDELHLLCTGLGLVGLAALFALRLRR